MVNFNVLNDKMIEFFDDIGLDCKIDIEDKNFDLTGELSKDDLGAFAFKVSVAKSDSHFLFYIILFNINPSFKVYDLINDFNQKNLYFTASLTGENLLVLRSRKFFTSESHIVQTTHVLFNLFLEDSNIDDLKMIIKAAK